MSLKNKDGSKYVLKGVNPIASKQNNDDDFILHNMNWQSINLPDLSKLSHLNSNLDTSNTSNWTTESFDTVVEEAPIEEEVLDNPQDIEDVEEEIKIVEKLQKSRAKSKPVKNAVDIWCLPAKIRKDPNEVDPYKKLTIEYFDKVMIEGVIVHLDAFHLTFWTNVDISQKGSIIYPFRNSEGRPLDLYSWWKVSEIIGPDEDERLIKSGGWIFVCVPSEYTPHFDD